MIAQLLIAIFFFLFAFQLKAQEEVFYLEEWYATEGEQEATASGREFSITDASSNLYVAGSSLNSHDKYDFSLTKYNSSGTQLWSTTYNVPDSTGTVLLGDVTVDGAGNILATGSVYNGSTNGYDVFVVKYATDGTQSWARLYNGAGSISDGGTSLAVDASNNVYVGGGTLTASNSMDMLCLKYNSSGTFQWAATVDNNGLYDIAGLVYMRTATIVGLVGASEQSASSWAAGNVFLYASTGTEFQGFTVSNQTDLDEIVDFKIDASENVYVTGYTDAGGNGQDFKTVKLDDELDVIWETVYNGEANGDDRPNALALDNSGNTYVAGYTTGSGGKDYTVVKYNSSGVQQWASIYAGAAAGDDEALALTVGADGQVYVTGYANDNGTKDYFTRILDPSDGDKVWEAAFNGLENEDDRGTSIEVDGDGNIAVLGRNGTQSGNTEYTTVRYAKKELVIPPDSEAVSSAISFIENRGQLTDTSGAEVPAVKFYSDAVYPPVYIQDHKLSFVTSSIDTSATTPDTLHRVDMAFKGSKTGQEAGVFGMDQRGRYNNYYLGHIPEGRARVGLYERAVQTDVYDGIDLHYYSNRAGMKYYFVLSSGADPADIELEFSGQSSLSVDTNGDLVVGTSIGDFRLPAPEAYQVDSTGQEVSTGWTPSYSVSDSVVTFSGSGSYDQNSSLVLKIEREPGNGGTAPTEEWITHFGGEEAPLEDINSIEVDEQGNIFIGGFSSTFNFPLVDGELISIDFAGDFVDGMVGYFTEDAVLQYLTFIGGSSNDNPRDITLHDGKIMVVGETSSDDFPLDPENIGEQDAFVAVLNATSGELEASRIFGSELDDVFQGVDSYGSNFLVVGYSASGSIPAVNLPGAYNQSTNSGKDEGLILEIDNELEVVWSTYFGGKGGDFAMDVEVNTDNNHFYVTGNTDTERYATNTCAPPTSGGGFPNCKPSGASQFSFANGASPILITSDLFIAEFDANRSLVWSTFFGGEDIDKISSAGNTSVAINYQNQGEIAIIGATFDYANFPTSPGGGYSQNISGAGLFLAKFKDRSHTWGTSFGCIDDAAFFPFLGESCVFDNGNLFVLGHTDCLPQSSADYCTAPSTSVFPICLPPSSSNVFFQGGTNPAYEGNGDSFIAAFDENENLTYSTYFGGNGKDLIRDAVFDSNARLHFVGQSTSSASFPWRFPTTPIDVYRQEELFGNEDGYIARLPMGNIVQNSEVNTEEQGMLLFPNPNRGQFSVSLPDQMVNNNYVINVYDSRGVLVHRDETNGRQLLSLDLHQLPAGIYSFSILNYSRLFIVK